MDAAIEVAATARCTASPNPWVGAVVADREGAEVGRGATSPPGGAHAEVNALAIAGGASTGGTLYVTLEPCSHVGRTGPCVDAIVDAGIERVVVAIIDPDSNVAGSGVEILRGSGIDVDVGLRREVVERQLAPYLTHRRTGRPHVVLKLAATLDGRTAAPDGTSRWITGTAARVDVHRLRAESDAVLVGAGTVRTDDPELNVRLYRPPGVGDAPLDPLRVVLGRVPEVARVHPCREVEGDLGTVLDALGRDGVLQLLVEGGATVAGDFHRANLVDSYVVYLAPALFGGDDARPLFAGSGVPTIDDLWRGRLVDVTRMGDDIRIELDGRAVSHEAEQNLSGDAR